MSAAQVSIPFRTQIHSACRETQQLANSTGIIVLPLGAEAIKGQELGAEYYLEAAPVVEIQIARAGYRLAKWLDLMVSFITSSQDLGDL